MSARSWLAGRGGHPGRGLHGLAELGNEPGIDPVGLGAQKARTAKGFDLGRVDDRDPEPSVGEKLGDGFPIDPGRLHADPRMIGVVLLQPLRQPHETLRAIRDNLALELARRQQQRTIELGLGDIDPEIEHCIHDEPSHAIHLVNAGCRIVRAEDTVRFLARVKSSIRRKIYASSFSLKGGNGVRIPALDLSKDLLDSKFIIQGRNRLFGFRRMGSSDEPHDFVRSIGAIG